MDMLRRIGLFLGWLTSVLAGITAVFYGFGFLAANAQESMLGLDWASRPRDTVWYLGYGAKALAALGTVAAFVLPLIVLAVEALRGLAPRLVGPWPLSVLLIALNIALLVCLVPVTGTLSDLLFAPWDVLCTGSDTLLARVAGAQAESLIWQAWGRLALVTVILTLAGYALNRVAAAPEEPALPLVIGLVAGFSATLAVPMIYGHLLDMVEPRPLTETSALPAPLPDVALYHVASARGGIWAWEPAARQVHWIADGALEHIGYGPGETLRSAACR